LYLQKDRFGSGIIMLHAPQVSIVIPCFNEEKVIGKTFSTIKTYLAETDPKLAYEMILVNDGSSDRTMEIISSLAAANDTVKVISFAYNQGRGAAIKAGIKRSIGEYVIILDADLSYDEEHISEILEKFKQDPKIDVVVVSAYSPEGVVRNVPFRRLIASRMANWLLSGYFDNSISTVTCVVRGYRGTLIRGMDLLENGKELHLEILRKSRLLGAKIVEVPGRLVWAESKFSGPRRPTNLKFVSAAGNHVLYAVLNKPTRFLGVFTALILFLGLYETTVVFFQLLKNWDFALTRFTSGLWRGLSLTFAQSPHSIVIAVTALILGFQSLTFLILFTILKLQHEESLKHQMLILEKLHRLNEKPD
jgi:glycosyltransferase involved in cell wall biosynthesis